MFSGPDDISLAYIAFCFFNGYYGNGLWAEEYNFLGLGKMKLGFLMVYVIFSLEICAVLSGVCTNLWHARNRDQFKSMYSGKLSFFYHTSYLFVMASVFLSYSLLTESKAVKEYPKLVMTAYGSHFLQGTLRAMISGVTLEDF